MKIAAVTMAYNEPEYLPIWLRYYGGALGRENCYIIDHGSDDGSTSDLSGANVVRIPRSPKDNVKRTQYISEFASSLLHWYQSVLCVDVDEIVSIDPSKHSSLRAYIESNQHEVVNAIGFDVWHVPELEAPLDETLPVLWQRHWIRFSSSMCKPVLINRPTTWAPGFHSADAPVKFDELFLFHLRYFDIDIARRRLARTRSMEWSDEKAGRHQRLTDEEFDRLFRSGSGLRRLKGHEIDINEPVIGGYIHRVLMSEKPPQRGEYNLDLHIFGNELFEVPKRFSTCF